MNIGDKVRITQIPPDLPDDDLGTKKLFELCLGRAFVVASLESVDGLEHDLVELQVGEVVGEPSCMQTIWIEPEFLETVEDLS